MSGVVVYSYYAVSRFRVLHWLSIERYIVLPFSSSSAVGERLSLVGILWWSVLIGNDSDSVC